MTTRSGTPLSSFSKVTSRMWWKKYVNNASPRTARDEGRGEPLPVPAQALSRNLRHHFLR